MSLADLFILVFMANVIVCCWLFVVFFCIGFFDKKEKKIKSKFDDKRGGMRL